MRGDLVFTGDLTPIDQGLGQDLGVFLYRHGQTQPVVLPGDPLPGGGHLVRVSGQTGNIDINARGDVTFNAILDTDDNGDGEADSGLYLWSRGELSVIARTGTVVPNVGAVRGLRPPGVGGAGFPFVGSGGALNDRGQVLFQATLEDGRGVLLIATPERQGPAGKTSSLNGGEANQHGTGSPADLPAAVVDHVIAGVNSSSGSVTRRSDRSSRSSREQK